MGTTENKKSGRTVHHKICEQCGKPFDTIYKANRFCCSTWNNGSSLNVIPGEDVIKIIQEKTK